MQFYEKFTHMYRLLNLNHKIVAKQTGIDVSLLSRFKTGKRLPSDKNGQYHDFAKLFLSCIKTAAQRDTINMIITGHRITIPHVIAEIDIFEDWLKSSSARPEMSLMSYVAQTDRLAQMRAIITSKDETILKTTHIKLDPQTRTDFYIYKDNEGKREAVLYFLNTALELEHPTDIYIYSDEDPGWWMEDETFPKLWASFLRAITLKGHTINTIFLTTRPSEQYIHALNTWLPLMLVGKINTFYFADYAIQTVKSTTFVIKDSLCYVSLSSRLSDLEKIGYLHVDLPSIRMQTALFLGRMAGCRSLMTTYTTETQLALLERMLQSESQDYPLKTFSLFPNPLFLPFSVFEKYSLTLPLEMRQRYMSIIRKYLTYIDNALPTIQVHEVTPFNKLRDLVLDPNAYYFESSFFGNKELKLTKNELKLYVNNIIDVLQRCPSYELIFLQQQSTYKELDININVRQHTHALITPINKSPLDHIALFSREGNTVMTLFKYLTSLQSNIPSAYRQKEETLQNLYTLQALLP